MADYKTEMARKAQALAEKCFLAGNVSGARKWMQSAVKLAPDLSGNTQAVAAYDVHAAAARRLPGAGGAPDWYAVLGLPDPRSGPGGAAPLTHDAIKKQHRRLCLLVHPDKNPSAAADGAFKLVQAAWDALSARHPPSTATVPTPTQGPPPPQRQAPPPRPPDPPTKPQSRPRPQVVPMPRRAATPPTTSYSGAAKGPQPQKGRRVSPPPAYRPPSPTAGKCPSCGAHTSMGKWRFRCASCQWSPNDGWHDDEEDDFFEYFY